MRKATMILCGAAAVLLISNQFVAAQGRVGGILHGVADIVDAATAGPVVVRPRPAVVFPRPAIVVPRPAVVVPRPVIVAPVPAVAVYPQPVAVAAYPTVKRPAYIRVANPATNTAPVSYTLDGYPYVIQPGFVQELAETYVIEFDRGGVFGVARYNMSDGTYTFTLTPAGSWELYHSP
jgi:hypothetical protein